MNQMDMDESARADGATIKLHGPEGFAGMRRAGRLAAETLDFITPHVQPGTTTLELDTLCRDFVAERGAISAPFGYRGFPKSICTSVNHVVCHGIPSDQAKLKSGDIINIDVTPIVDGWHGDSSRMFHIGEPTVKARRLVKITYEALMMGIEVVRPGARLSEIGRVIQAHAEKAHFSVVEIFSGHGLGKVFHDAPSVLHYVESRQNRSRGEPAYRPEEDIVFRPGMFLTIEPMINAGKVGVKVLEDGWTAVTRDKSLSAQFEHSLGVTEDGCEIFTLSPKGWTQPPYD